MSPALALRGSALLGLTSGAIAGDLRFITSASGSAASSISVNNCFSAAYDHYLITRSILGSGAGNPLRARLRVGGADASGADYRYQTLIADGASTAGSRFTAQTAWNEALGYTEATAFGIGRLWVSNPFAAVRTTAWTAFGYGHAANIALGLQVFEHDLTTSYDGITLYPSAGTITGTFYVYGLAV